MIPDDKESTVWKIYTHLCNCNNNIPRVRNSLQLGEWGELFVLVHIILWGEHTQRRMDMGCTWEVITEKYPHLSYFFGKYFNQLFPSKFYFFYKGVRLKRRTKITKWMKRGMKGGKRMGIKKSDVSCNLVFPLFASSSCFCHIFPSKRHILGQQTQKSGYMYVKMRWLPLYFNKHRV